LLKFDTKANEVDEPVVVVVARPGKESAASEQRLERNNRGNRENTREPARKHYIQNFTLLAKETRWESPRDSRAWIY